MTAFIGQMMLSVAPTYTLQPCLKVSVFDCFRDSCNSLGSFLLSMQHHIVVNVKRSHIIHPWVW